MLVTPNIDRERVIREKRAIAASIYRESFEDYVRDGWHVFEPNGRPFVDNIGTQAIIEHLQALGDGTITRLGIAVSPGFGKSTLASIAFPSWMWTKNPAWRVITASHALDLALINANKFSRVIESDWYRDHFSIAVSSFEDPVNLESDAVHTMITTASGVRFSLGVGGSLTGKRGDGGVIDDSLNAVDATSMLEVEKVNRWFDTAFFNRLDRGEFAPIAVIQQCLDGNDLIAHVRELGYEMLVLPARYETNRRCVTSLWADPRAIEGEILAPEIHSEVYLDEQLRVLRPHGFATQFQQRPTVRGGDRFKIADWRFCQLHGDGTPKRRPEQARKDAALVLGWKTDGTLDVDFVCLSVDPTGGSTNETASNLGITVVTGKGERRFILADLTPGVCSWTQTKIALRSALIKTSDLTAWSRGILVLVENKALGPSAIGEIEDWIGAGLRNSVGKTIHAKVLAYEPSGKGAKDARADFLEPMVEDGLMYVLDGADWVCRPPTGCNETLIDEFAAHPRKTKNDRIDTVAQACDHYRDAINIRTRWAVLSS
jgi:phage terminase large subunit-like protein